MQCVVLARSRRKTMPRFKTSKGWVKFPKNRKQEETYSKSEVIEIIHYVSWRCRGFDSMKYCKQYLKDFEEEKQEKEHD